MTTAEKRDQQLVDHVILADNHLGQLAADSLPRLVELADEEIGKR